MAKLIIIAAIGKNREIGKNNTLIWHLKEDLKFFKEHTMNHKIVMGYNTFASLPKLLPGRDHFILTHKEIDIEGVHVFHDFVKMSNYLQQLDEDIYIIGGETIYKLFIDIVDELLLTEIEAESLDADAYFPKFDKSKYERIIEKENEENDIKYNHIRYRRRK